MVSLKGSVACITGASSGIGAACAEAFAEQGCLLLLCARRIDRLNAFADSLRKKYNTEVNTAQLDVRNLPAVDSVFAGLAAPWRSIDILVNNAGLSRGLEKLHEGNQADWDEMIDTNIKGLLYVSRAVIPGMVKRNKGHIINIGSIAGHQVYPKGNVYCATKSAVYALTHGMKQDLLGTGVRVSSIDPGLVETEFSLVRFHGDTERAAGVYANITPLTGRDIAEIAVFCATRPPHVNILDTIVFPTVQSSATLVDRK